MSAHAFAAAPTSATAERIGSPGAVAVAKGRAPLARIPSPPAPAGPMPPSPLRHPTAPVHEVDDATLTTLSADLALVSATAMHGLVVPDAEIAGEIGGQATLSALFACGAAPESAEAIVAVPDAPAFVQADLARRMSAGLARAAEAAGCRIVAGQTVVGTAALVGLAVRGFAHPAQLKRRVGAQVGDCVVVTKPIGVGALLERRMNGYVAPALWYGVLDSLRASNAVGVMLGAMAGVHAMTVVGQRGLLGHACDIAAMSGRSVTIDYASVPHFAGARQAVAAGYVPQETFANLHECEGRCAIAGTVREKDRALLCDPQTNGGLLLTVQPDQIPAVVAACRRHGQEAAVIGLVGPMGEESATCAVTLSHRHGD